MNALQRDRLLAVLAAVLALSYIAAARGIEDSLLADAVGAGGVPQGVGIAMLLCAVSLFAKSFMTRTAAASVTVDAAADASRVASPDAVGAADGADAEVAPAPRAAALRTGALVLLLLGYGLVLPLLGYPLALSLLVLGAGAVAGAPMRWPLLLSAGLAGPLMWLLFDKLLQVRMPSGTLWG